MKGGGGGRREQRGLSEKVRKGPREGFREDLCGGCFWLRGEG